METGSYGFLYNIFPELFYVVDRSATPAWVLNDFMYSHNIMLVYGGQAEFFCNNSVCTAKKGDMIYYKPGDARYARTFPGNPIKCFAVDFQYACPVFRNGEWEIMYADLPFSFFQSITDEMLFSKLTDLFSRLAKSALTANRFGRREKEVFTEILLLLFEYCGKNRYNYSNIRKVERVINYMTENFAGHVTLGELARYAGICPSYLGRIFKRITGRSTMDYLIEIRINRAKILLRDGFSVSETSRLVGFNDIYYFSRAFKERVGICPSKYFGVSAM
ncbi:MAG: helix-turn-helix domain-containing protein [Acetivibrionales bacterium]|jgi:AraC-like DNA-binding protein